MANSIGPPKIPTNSKSARNQHRSETMITIKQSRESVDVSQTSVASIQLRLSLKDLSFASFGALTYAIWTFGAIAIVLMSIGLILGINGAEKNKPLIAFVLLLSLSTGVVIAIQKGRHQHANELEQRQRYTADVAALFDGIVLRGIHHVSICGISHAWYISDLEDFGPAYVVTTDERDVAYLCGQILEDYDNLGEGLTSVGSEIQLMVDGETLEIKECSFQGRRIPVSEQFSFRELPVSLYSGFVILRTGTISIPPPTASPL